MKRLTSFKDITGQVFGNWTALSVTTQCGNGGYRWLCKCTCGAEKEVKGSSLISGASKSCGCLTAKPFSLRGSKVYRAWRGMKTRCYNPNSHSYANYGGRGITVCDRWLHSFDDFLADMGMPNDSSLTIDRIDCNGNYCPENCRWADVKTQSYNKRSAVLTGFNPEEWPYGHVYIIRLTKAGLSREAIIRHAEMRMETFSHRVKNCAKLLTKLERIKDSKYYKANEI